MHVHIIVGTREIAFVGQIIGVNLPTQMPPVIKNRGIHQTIRGNGECVQQIARLGRVVVGKPEVILKWGLINSVTRKSGYNKGTIRSDVWYLVVSTDVRRHRLISSDYLGRTGYAGRASRGWLLPRQSSNSESLEIDIANRPITFYKPT